MFFYISTITFSFKNKAAKKMVKEKECYANRGSYNLYESTSNCAELQFTKIMELKPCIWHTYT